MPDLNSLLKVLDAEDKSLDKFLIVELCESRVAWVVLRRSAIRHWAMTGAEVTDSLWSSEWQRQVLNASQNDLGELRMLGTRYGGNNHLKEILSKTSQTWPTDIDCVIPIGSLSSMKPFVELLKTRFAAKVLPPQEIIHFPPDLHSINAEIGQIHPPHSDDDYFLQVVKLESGKLIWDSIKLIGKDEPLPIQEIVLYRALEVAGATPAQIVVVIRRGDVKILARQFESPTRKNKFVLKCYFGFDDDAIRIRLWDATSAAPTRVEFVSRDVLKDVESTESRLPSVNTECTLDLAFIIDGTLRSKASAYSKPDLKDAKELVNAILNGLENLGTLSVRAGLCLYGDNPRLTGADYVIRPWDMRSLSQLKNVIRTDPQFMPVRDDMDYEAMLEVALQWANPSSNNSNNARLQWDANALNRFLIIIGYAPPHPFRGRELPVEYSTLFRHEPFKSNIDWEQQCSQIRHHRIKVISIWIGYPNLDNDVAVMKHSRHIWNQLAISMDDQDDNGLFYSFFEDTPVAKKIVKELQKRALGFNVAQGPIEFPFTKQEQSLRYKT